MNEDNSVYVNCGKRLKELRKGKKLTQSDVAKIMDISITSVVNYEAGTRKIPLEYLLAFARFYGVSVDFLLDNNPEPIVDGSAVITQKYAELWRNDPTIKTITSKEAEQIFAFTKFIISQRNENK